MVLKKNKNDFENFLVFEVNNSLYAIHSSSVIELIWLTEINSVDSSPIFIIGYINFRGAYLPILDLSLRQGNKTRKFNIQDRILILEFEKQKIGIYINEVHNVVDIESKSIIRKDISQNDKIISDALIQTQFGMTQIINLTSLMNFDILKKDERHLNNPYLAKLMTGLNESDLVIIKKRKDSYSKETIVPEYSSRQSIVVFKLGSELFSIDLKFILEFSNGDGITKIPCVPAHILGCINLRGDILVLIDLSYIIKSEKTRESKTNKIIVIRKNDMLLGLVTESLLDVIYLSSDKILNTPVEKQKSEGDFLKGTCLYNSEIVGLIDVDKIFEYEKLYVDEHVSKRME
jgi:purine-binding chemotaxis protein CheW